MRKPGTEVPGKIENCRVPQGRHLQRVGPVVNQRQELIPRLLLLSETSQHRRRDRGGMLLLYSAHHHAEMAGLDNYPHSLRMNRVLNGLGNLRGQAFLNLQTAGENFYQARNFAQSDHFAVRNIGNMHLAEKRQHVMLAQAEHFDIFHNHHFVVGHA